MNKRELYEQLQSNLQNKLQLPPDKPEETVESTIMACWHFAAGFPKSASEAIKSPLPDLTGDQITLLHDLIDKRLQDIPLAYLTGRQNFMGIELLADERALIPRKETELLAKMALEISRQIVESNNKIQIMDIGCGSGNLALTMAKFNKDALVHASDLSHGAVELAKENARFLGLQDRVEIRQGDLFAPFQTQAYYEDTDLIICNPPYISSGKIPSMETEILGHEPSLAFDGGKFGTQIIIKLISEAPKFLKKSGWVIFEVGLGQGEFVEQLCERTNCYSQIEPIADEDGNIRVIRAQRA
jgi:release factor glutamine methyltransferase